MRNIVKKHEMWDQTNAKQVEAKWDGVIYPKNHFIDFSFTT